ncbi:hypothetical protein QP162_12560 [Sphingomonas aurantiaca]|uniref:hypothetical protein n=1 Tax=Sphingomonas aurantiaca TaxID=185949 RepID=UPI002FDFD1D4
MRAASHRVYESAIAGNVGDDPIAASGKWIDVGPTNRWAMFDQALGSLTSAANAITVTLTAAAIQAVALLDVTAATVRLQATGYDRTIAASAGATTFLDLPAGTTRVTVTIAGGSVSVGTLLVGKLVGLGVTEGSPTSGITDYSRKDVDDFGAVTIVERAWSKRMAAKSLITTASIDVVANRIAAVRAVPSLWIGLDGLDSLTVYGFFKEFSIEVGETTSKLSLSIEGLSTAGKIEPLGAQVNWPDIADPTGTKPADNADVTGEHTSKDTNAVGGRPAAEVTGGIDRAITGVADLIKTYGSTDSAAKSADAASAAATAAQTARDQSSVARDAATQARTAAGDFAGQADTARRLSENARTLADQANTAASAARDAAVQARDGAGTANVAAQGAQRAASENAEAARVSATGASGSASTASGQASIATQKADAAGQSAATSSAQADIATTKAGQASTSASRAATSESNAAGSANAASSSAQVTASVRDAAQALFEKQYPPTLDPIGRTAYYSFGAIAGPSAEWPQPYATQVPANGLTAEWTHRFNKPIEKVVGRRYRFTAWVYSYATNLFFFASTYDGPNAGSVNRWNGIKGTAITPVSQGWNKIVGEFVVDDGFQAFIWPSVNIQPQNGPNNGQYHITGIVLKDVTSEVAAQGYATASASSASTASAKAEASSQSATAADTARAAAATASGQAEASRNQAAVSASSASGSANSAMSSAQVAASAKDAAQASEGKASGSASSSAQNASSASASKDAAAQSASASQTSAANAATRLGAGRHVSQRGCAVAHGRARFLGSGCIERQRVEQARAIRHRRSSTSLRPATLAPIQRDAYMLTAPQVTISGPGNGWPQAYISATQANAFNYEVYVMFKRRLPRNASKRYRVTAFGYSYATNVVFFLGLYGATGEESSTTTADKYFGTMATNTPKATGFFQLSGEFNVDDNTGSPFFDPRIVINTTDGKVNNGLVHTTGIIVEDITQEYAARQQATASATSASAASASKDAASQSASAAQTSATNAATSAGQALTYRNDASTSANTAAGSASSAAQQAGVAVSARNDTAALHDDTGALRDSAAGFANASSGSASLASSKADASAQSASAADASRAAAVTAKGQSEASREQAAASASTASGSANSASSSANVSASARDVAIINTALSGQSTFEQGGLYWQDDWTGAPDARTDRANTSKSYRVENTRPVCTIAPNVRVHLCPKQAFPNTAGRTYRVEIVGYPTEAAGGQICLDMIGFNADYVGAGLNLTGEYGRPVQTPLTSYKLDYTCDGSRALLRPRLVCYDDRRGSFNVVSFTIEDVTSEKAAGNSATAASTSAASAAASNGQAGQKASAANQSATNAATSAGNASTSAGQAATSASTAAGSANSATSSANLAASAQGGAVGALQSLRPTSLAPDARSAWSYNGKIVGPDSNWPTPYLTQVDSGQQNFESYVRPNKPLPNVPGRTYRLTTYVFSYGTNVRFSLAGYDGPNEATINGFMGFATGAEQSVTPQSTGFRKITGELTVSEANQACIWPSVVINCDGGPNNGAYHCGVLEIVDITSEKAAQGAANASASSASAAQASSTSAGQSASSATQSANTATTANGQAQQAASAAQGSAAAANASEASARTFSTTASSYSARLEQ